MELHNLKNNNIMKTEWQEGYDKGYQKGTIVGAIVANVVYIGLTLIFN